MMRTSACKKCGAVMVWLNLKGKPHPYDDADGKVSHFDTCPYAAHFRSYPRVGVVGTADTPDGKVKCKVFSWHERYSEVGGQSVCCVWATLKVVDENAGVFELPRYVKLNWTTERGRFVEDTVKRKEKREQEELEFS